MTTVDRPAVERWVAAYERAWRTAGTVGLDLLFSPQVRYHPSPWAPALSGIDAIRQFWEEERDGPDEPFTLVAAVLAVDGDTAVVRVAVDYADPPRQWRDLWVIRFDDAGRCAEFEEWPFTPDQPDGHPEGARPA